MHFTPIVAVALLSISTTVQAVPINQQRDTLGLFTTGSNAAIGSEPPCPPEQQGPSIVANTEPKKDDSALGFKPVQITSNNAGNADIFSPDCHGCGGGGPSNNDALLNIHLDNGGNLKIGDNKVPGMGGFPSMDGLGDMPFGFGGRQNNAGRPPLDGNGMGLGDGGLPLGGGGAGGPGSDDGTDINIHTPGGTPQASITPIDGLIINLNPSDGNGAPVDDSLGNFGGQRNNAGRPQDPPANNGGETPVVVAQPPPAEASPEPTPPAAEQPAPAPAAEEPAPALEPSPAPVPAPQPEHPTPTTDNGGANANDEDNSNPEPAPAPSAEASPAAASPQPEPTPSAEPTPAQEPSPSPSPEPASSPSPEPAPSPSPEPAPAPSPSPSPASESTPPPSDNASSTPPSDTNEDDDSGFTGGRKNNAGLPPPLGATCGANGCPQSVIVCPSDLSSPINVHYELDAQPNAHACLDLGLPFVMPEGMYICPEDSSNFINVHAETSKDTFLGKIVRLCLDVGVLPANVLDGVLC